MSTDICRWIVLLLFLVLWTNYSNSKEIRVVCYYTNWSVYRPGTAKFSPQNINPYLCTHLVYAFGGFTKENTLKPFDKYQDIEKGGYAKFTGLKTYNKNLKTLLAIGGWNEGSSRFSPMVANPDRRKELIKNAIKFLRQNHFDGLDLDWEYPSFRDGGKSRDRDNYAQLVQELREEFERESEKTGRPRLLLTMAVPAGIEYINKGYDVPKLTKYLDWMNILSYDYHSAFEPAVNHHAPLYSLEEPSEYNYDTELNIDYTIQHYLEKGADPNKLVLGIPTYGRSYTLFNPDANEIGAPADGPGDMGEATRENGYLAYYEICEYIKSQDWEVVQPDPDAMGPYAFKDNQWVGYDDDAIARKKAAYVAEKGLGGIMFWSIDNDDFRGNCHGKPYPIIEAAKEALISAYGLTDENLVSPPSKPIKTKTRTRPQTSSKSTTEKETSEKKRVSTSSRRRNRVKTKTNDTARPNSRSKSRRKQVTTTEGTVHSSLELVTPSYTTPAPPSTPDMAGGFKCEDEGFYPHPKDCKKYYWCLSGPGELGIIAHQFTCPAGLYFNKAADSCDYTRNVLCNKKLSKGTTTTTTTTTEATTSKTTPSSTARVPPRITAATSRTTVFRTSTTTEAYEDEYEYEDDDEEDLEENKNSEEDPKVIKELLDLIRKAGGIEQLEKQLKIHDDGSASVSHPDATTPSSISKSLVERVLGKAAAKNKADGKRNSYSFLNRNSRGPQNDGLKTTDEKQTKERGRPQYTTITRQRSRVTETDEEAEESDDEESAKEDNRKQPEYVNIRRGRVSTTTEEPEDNSKLQINRNKILGEDENEEQTTRKQYVNIRRQRPSTTEETSTSKYTVIRRGSTTEANISEDPSNDKRRGSTTPSSEDSTTIGKKRGTTISDGESLSDTRSKYKIIRRGSTTESSVDNQETTLPTKRRGSTSPSVQDVSEKEKTKATTVSSTTSNEKYKILRRGSTTETSQDTKTTTDDSDLKSSSTPIISTTQELEDVTNNSESENSVTTDEQLLITSPESLSVTTTASLSTAKAGSKLSDSSGEGVLETQAPQLLQPRPFSLSTSDPTSSLKPVTESSTLVTKVSESNKYKPRLRQKPPSTQIDIISTTVLTTEKSTPFRTRAPSRFKLTTPRQVDHQTSRPSVRARKRFSTTTEHYSENYDEYDLNRSYRPSEIADLSSLTAVDFAALKELNKLSNPSRHRRIRPSTTTTTTTTQKPEEDLKTSSRTLPLARQLLDGTVFGKSRRIIPNKKEPILEDQINSSSDTTHRIRPFTRTPSTFSTITSTTEETTRQTLRNRKIIRRLRPTVASKLRAQNENNQIPLKRPSVRSNTTNSTETENLIENASVNSLYSRRYSRPSTTLAEEINELSTTTEILEKRSTELPKEEDDQNETSEDVSAEEGENIKLSESNIRENSNVNNDNILSSDEDKKLRRKILKRIKSKVDEDEKTTTEPNVIIRTRKIIRKLKPTESTLLTSTTESTDSSTKGRKRKIIRRLRPTTAATEENSSSSEVSTTQKNLYIRGRPFISHALNKKTDDGETKPTTGLPSTESEAVRQNLAPVREDLTKYKTSYKSKYKTIARTTTARTTTPVSEKEIQDSSNEKANLEKNTKEPLIHTIDRSKYSTINRGTTSTTTNYDDDVVRENNKEEEEVNVSNRPRYRIYRPTTFHDDDDEIISEHDEIIDESDNFSTKSPKYRILDPILSRNNDTEHNEESIGTRISIPVEEQLSDKPDLDVSEKTLANDSKREESSSTENKEFETLTTSTEDSTTTVDVVDIENQENNSKENITLSGDETETSTEDEKTEADNEEVVTTTTTVRNYVNPILSRQKNRPSYKRPKITTQNPLKTTSSGSKFKYRAFSRSTTHTPKRIVIKEENHNNEQEEERQFIPKNARNRYTTYIENKTEPNTNTVLSTTTEFIIDANATDLNIGSENNATTEVYELSAVNATNDISAINDTTATNDASATSDTSTTDAAEITTLYEYGNVTTPKLDSDSNVTERSFTVTQPNIEIIGDTTIEETATTAYEANTVLANIEVTNRTETESSSLPEVTTLAGTEVNTVGNVTNDDTIETTTDRIETSSIAAFNTTTETTTPYHPKSTLRSIQNRPRYNSPKRLTTSESTTTTRPSHRFTQRNRSQGSNSRFVTPNLRSTTPTSPLKNRAIYKYSTTERTKFITEEIENDDDDYENAENNEEVEEETDQLYTPRTPSSYTPQTNYKAKIGNRPSFRRTTETPKILEETSKDEDIEEETDEQIYTPKNSYAEKSKSKPRISNRPDVPSFRKTTEAPKVTEDLGDIDTEAVKNRNKNLFSKKRKMNTPFAGYTQNQTAPNEEKTAENANEETISDEERIVATTEHTTPATILTTTPVILESVTKPSTNAFETTEYLTTLHHVFAETNNVTEKESETTTIPTIENTPNTTNSKVEKIIEVNRIVEIHEMNKTDEHKDNKVIDKIGVVNRVTVVKVVDGNPNPEENEITETTSESTTLLPNEKSLQTKLESGEIEIATVKEIPNPKIKGGLDAIINPFELSSERQDRKFEIYGQSRIIDYSSKDVKTNNEKNAEILDGRSNINIITPRPYYSTEASTISLEALFQTDTPQKLNNNLLKPSNDDELLETGNSRYVNVRILGDEEKHIKDESRLVPVKVLKGEDYITMKAQVVEVTPKVTKDIIKIVPIQVEMSRKLIAPSDFHTNIENGVPKVNLHILKSENN